MDAFDADVLIYAAEPRHPLGEKVSVLMAERSSDPDTQTVGIGSVLLVPELLAKPFRYGHDSEMTRIAAYLSRLDLWPVDASIASLATAVAASHRLKPIDAIHLATALAAGADRFLTNNTRDFEVGRSELGIEIVSPWDL